MVVKMKNKKDKVEEVVQDKDRTTYYNYSQAFRVLDRIHNALPQEFLWWVCSGEGIEAYSTDIFEENNPSIYLSKYPSAVNLQECLQASFFNADKIDNYTVQPSQRLISIDRLRYRPNWTSSTNVEEILKRAALIGLVSVFDIKRGRFCLREENSKDFFALSLAGRELIRNPLAVFKLTEILTIERALLNRSREDCIKELNGI